MCTWVIVLLGHIAPEHKMTDRNLANRLEVREFEKNGHRGCNSSGGGNIDIRQRALLLVGQLLLSACLNFNLLFLQARAMSMRVDLW